MHIAFAGTPELAASALRALIEAGYEIVLVLTQPDRPSGRGMKLTASPVKQLALAHAIPVHQPVSLTVEAAQATLARANAEVMVVAAYGLLLPPAVLALPKYGCLNIHPSLLPRWRGAAPIERAILAGDEETGVSMMQMDEGLDTGPVLLTRAIPITPIDTGATLRAKLARLGADLIVEALAKLPKGDLRAVPQPVEGVTYADKLAKAEAVVDWSRPAAAIERKIRAFNPFPVAQTTWRGEPLRLWQARTGGGGMRVPGAVIDADANGIIVSCGEGTLLITELQKAGGKRLTAAQFLAGNKIEPGEIWGETP